jgi:ligand-binding sensor domain-containing protein
VFFYSVATSPFENGVVYAGTNSGIYSYKSGTWSALGLTDLSVTYVAADPTRPGVIYSGTTNGAYYSKDNGVTWNFVDDHLRGHTILSIHIDPTNPNVVYFSTKTHGVYLAAIRF